jgi:hypothetical protein
VPHPPVPTPSVEHLAALVHVLSDGLALQPGDPPRIVRVRHLDEPDADVEVGLRTLEAGAHPLDGLVGMAADDDWSAVGVVATGRLRHLDHVDHLDHLDRPESVRTAHLVGRDGSWAVRWQPIDGGDPVEIAGAPGDADVPVGRIDDALRRCLGLPTAPPTTSTIGFWSARWFDAVVAEAATAAGHRRLRRWHAVARLHPAVPALVADLSEIVTPERLVELGEALARLRDWEEARRSVAAGTLVVPGLDAETAAWLDDGAFSRWALAGFPDLAELARAVDCLVPPSVSASVCDVLSRWTRSG